MACVKFTLFTGDGTQSEPIEKVPAGEVADFTSFQDFLLDYYEVTESNVEVHLHFQNEMPCSGDSDVSQRLWKALAKARQSSSSGSSSESHRPVYFVCFAGGQDNDGCIPDDYDEEEEEEEEGEDEDEETALTTPTPPPERSPNAHRSSNLDSTSSGTVPRGSTSRPKDRSTIIVDASINEDLPSPHGHKRRTPGSDTYGRPTKSPRLHTNSPPRSPPPVESARDPSATLGDDPQESEHESMLRAKTPDGKFIIGTLIKTKHAVAATPSSRGHLYFQTLDFDLEGNSLKPHELKSPAYFDLAYRGVFEKYRNSRADLGSMLLRMSSGLPANVEPVSKGQIGRKHLRPCEPCRIAGFVCFESATKRSSCVRCINLRVKCSYSRHYPRTYLTSAARSLLPTKVSSVARSSSASDQEKMGSTGEDEGSTFAVVDLTTRAESESSLDHQSSNNRHGSFPLPPRYAE